MKILLFLYARSILEKSWDVWDPSTVRASLVVAKCCLSVYKVPSMVVIGVLRDMMSGTVVKDEA